MQVAPHVLKVGSQNTKVKLDAPYVLAVNFRTPLLKVSAMNVPVAGTNLSEMTAMQTIHAKSVKPVRLRSVVVSRLAQCALLVAFLLQIFP